MFARTYDEMTKTMNGRSSASPLENTNNTLIPAVKPSKSKERARTSQERGDPATSLAAVELAMVNKRQDCNLLLSLEGYNNT